MTGKVPIQQLITPAEAMELFRYAGIQEMHIAKDLHDFYRTQKGRYSDSLWDMMSLLSFVYDTGRVQGMREERAKRKEQEPALAVERTESFYSTARELSDFIAALPLSREENDRLIALIIQQVQDGEQGAFAHGLRIGKEFAGWEENE